jgi:hypothetical protein
MTVSAKRIWVHLCAVSRTHWGLGVCGQYGKHKALTVLRLPGLIFSHLAPVIRIANSSTLGYPQEVPLQVTCVKFILVQNVSVMTSKNGFLLIVMDGKNY